MLRSYLFIDLEDRPKHGAAYLEVACISDNKTNHVDLDGTSVNGLPSCTYSNFIGKSPVASYQDLVGLAGM